MLSRRSFLALSTTFTTTASWANLLKAEESEELYASAFSTQDGKHYFGIVNELGSILWKSQLPDRAHAPIVHPNQAIIGIVARRPGFFIRFYNLESQQLIQNIEPHKDHHFYGHAIFTKDGKRLITQENHFPTGQGKIFIREWPSGDITHEYSSNGIGPHESVLWNNDTLIIANGGLKTHPDNDRNILNLETMDPNISYLSLLNGKIINDAFHPKEYSKLSIRHLDVNNKGVAALGFQYKGDIRDQVPLLALSHINWPEMKYLPLPENIRVRFKQYCGSVCFDKSGSILAASTPRGSLVAYWDINSQTFLGIKNCRDVCGIAPTKIPHEFILTSGTGAQIKNNPISNISSLIKKHTNILWDNHLKYISV